MITRDIQQLQVVPAFVHAARFHTCTFNGVTSVACAAGGSSAIGSSEFLPGFIIDRLGLSRNYNSLMVAPLVWGDYATTGAGIFWAGLSFGVMDASASGGTFAAYSTADWVVSRGLWAQTTATSTSGNIFSAVQRDVGLTSNIGIGAVLSSTTSTGGGVTITSLTTSTGFCYYAGPGASFSLQGAKRFVRVVIRPHLETTGCGAGTLDVRAAAIFGEPDEAPSPTGPAKRILVTSGCAT